MMEFMQLFNLEAEWIMKDKQMSIMSNKQVAFETSSWKIIMLFKLIWRYRLGPINMRRYMQNYLIDFLKIYDVV